MEVFARYILDLKLGLRMLRRSWGLTLAGGFAITVVVALATGSVSFLQTSLASSVPLEEGERLVGISMWDPVRQRRVRPSLAQYERWRESLTSVEDLGAFTSADRRSSAKPGTVEQPVNVAEMTASAFRAARVPPLLGRTVLDADERPGAPAVVVISYDVWRTRYGSDPDVIGRSLSLSGVDHEIVGVMPDRFGFPVNHRYWTPLRSASADDAAGVFVLGRLADGYEIENAQAEIEAVGTLPSPADERFERSPQVLSYTLALISSGDPLEEWLARFGGLLVSLLLLPPCLNIAILIYARTVTREEELLTRHALGAGRSRIVMQLFVEIFVLTLLSAALALALVHFFFSLDLFRSESDPFWIDYTQVPLVTVPFAAGLAIMAALIAGTIPALQVTGRLQQQGIGTLGSRATTGLGGAWTAIVVAQVALAIAALPATVEFGWGKLRPGLVGPGFPAERYLTFEYGVDAESQRANSTDQVPSRLDPREAQRRLVQRLGQEPGVVAATASAALPGAEPLGRIEVDTATGERPQRFEFVRLNRVDTEFLSTFGITLVAGRQISAGDLIVDTPPVIVNRTLAEQMGGSAVGERIRFAAFGQEPGGWREIVGVVADHPNHIDGPRVYAAQENLPARPQISLQLQSDASARSSDLAMRLPEIVSGVDSSLYVRNVRLLDDVYGQIELGESMQFVALAAVMLSVLLLSVAGVYALLSFTVNRRRREIGIRAALGAPPGRIVFGVFRQVLWQVGAGALLGLTASVLFDYFLPMERVGGRDVVGVLPAVAFTIIVTGCLAALVPARRALKVAPTDALRDMG